MAHILIVDDDRDILLTMRRMLESAGYEVLHAADGNAALKVLSAASVDMLIIDILMPERDGIETILKIRRANATMPILAMSGGGRGGTMRFLDMAKRLGADGTLAKPFKRAQLVQAVDSLLAR